MSKGVSNNTEKNLHCLDQVAFAACIGAIHHLGFYQLELFGGSKNILLIQPGVFRLDRRRLHTQRLQFLKGTEVFYTKFDQHLDVFVKYSQMYGFRDLKASYNVVFRQGLHCESYLFENSYSIFG